MRRVLCLHMPYLPTDRVRRQWPPDPPAEPLASPPAERQSHPAPPPIVLTRQVGASQIIERCCPRGAALGLRPGMTLGQAQALAPHLQAQPAQPLRDHALLDAIATWALRFTPAVQVVMPDTLLLDITGCQQLFGGEFNLAAAAQAELMRRGIHTRAAIADTVGAAYALAWAAREPLTLAPPGHAAAALAPLPPAALRIEPAVADQLAELGVRTIGDLLTLPRASLPTRFGHTLVQRLQQALGQSPEPLTPHQSDTTPLACCTFDSPIHQADTVRAAADALLRELLDDVARSGRALRRIDCLLYYAHRPATRFSIGLSRGSRSFRHVAELLSRRLENVDLGPGVAALTLAARETSPWRPPQAELFDNGTPPQNEALAILLDRLASRLGHAAILQALRVDDHQPEMAVAYLDGGIGELRLGTGEQGSGSGERGGASIGERGSRRSVPCSLFPDPRSPIPDPRSPFPHPSLRPLRLLQRPAPIRAVAIVPHGPPVWMYYAGREHRLLHATGPERIETAWWRGPDVRRDYYRVTSETGEQFWVFRDQGTGNGDQGTGSSEKQENSWRLHGVFV